MKRPEFSLTGYQATADFVALYPEIERLDSLGRGVDLIPDRASSEGLGGGKQARGARQDQVPRVNLSPFPRRPSQLPDVVRDQAVPEDQDVMLRRKPRQDLAKELDRKRMLRPKVDNDGKPQRLFGVMVTGRVPLHVHRPGHQAHARRAVELEVAPTDRAARERRHDFQELVTVQHGAGSIHGDRPVRPEFRESHQRPNFKVRHA